MATDKNVARRKLSMLELVTELGNVSKAMQDHGVFEAAVLRESAGFQLYGAEGPLFELQ